MWFTVQWPNQLQDGNYLWKGCMHHEPLKCAVTNGICSMDYGAHADVRHGAGGYFCKVG